MGRRNVGRSRSSGISISELELCRRQPSLAKAAASCNGPSVTGQFRVVTLSRSDAAKADVRTLALPPCCCNDPLFAGSDTPCPQPAGRGVRVRFSAEVGGISPSLNGSRYSEPTQ